QRSRMEGKKPPRKVVKVTNGDREFLTYTDEEGYFSFKNLLSGQWTVRVVQSPETAGTWQLSQNNLAVNVTPSNTSKVQFEMKTKVRKVKFSDKTLDIKIRNN